MINKVDLSGYICHICSGAKSGVIREYGEQHAAVQVTHAVSSLIKIQVVPSRVIVEKVSCHSITHRNC